MASEETTIDDLISRRATARASKDWALADKLLDEALALGFTLEDKSGGVTVAVSTELRAKSKEAKGKRRGEWC